MSDTEYYAKRIKLLEEYCDRLADEILYLLKRSAELQEQINNLTK